jgi:tetratricopeptide (TPR) repeat protein
MALETEKLEALRTLRELSLDHESGHLADVDYAELYAKAEGRVGEILRRLDQLGPPPAALPRTVVPVPAVPWSRRPAVLGAVGVGILGFGVTLGVLVTHYTTPAPVEPVMGAGPAAAMGEGGPPVAPPGMPGAGPAAGAPRPIPKEVLQGMLQAAHQSLDAGRYPEAIAAYKAVLRREPQNVEAITHLGVILALAGHADNALEAFDRALSIDPDYAHALWDKAGLLYETKRDYAAAIATWERFVRVGPPGPDREQALAKIKEAQARLAVAPAPGPAPRAQSSPKAPAPPVTR